MGKQLVRIKPRDRKAFAKWLLDSKSRDVRTISSTEFGVTAYVLLTIPEELLSGALIDSKPYRGVLAQAITSKPNGQVRLHKNDKGEAEVVVQRIEEPTAEPDPPMPDPEPTPVQAKPNIGNSSNEDGDIMVKDEPVSRPKKTTRKNTAKKATAKSETVGVRFGELPPEPAQKSES